VHLRWRIRGSGALVTKPTKRTFSFEFKLDVVRRFLAGETNIDLVREFDLSSPKLIGKWVSPYRAEGEEGLWPKPKGRPSGTPRRAEAPGVRAGAVAGGERLLGKIAGLEGAGTTVKVQAADGTHQQVIGVVVGGRSGMRGDLVLALPRAHGQGVADLNPTRRGLPGRAEDVGPGLIHLGSRVVDSERAEPEEAGSAIEQGAEHAG
ncbi:helix-turn-helix domain containing protein, partial [Arthrobacter sp. I2-34]